MKEIECVFYRMCAKEVFQRHIEKAVVIQEIEKRPELAVWARIRDNNKLFLEELNERIPNGYKDCDWWLRGLLADYVVRCSYGSNTELKTQSYIDWLDNTRFICNHQSIVRWCDEYQSFIEKEVSPQTPEEEKIRNKLSFRFDLKTIDEIIKELSAPSLKPRGIKHIYRKYSLGFSVSLTEFCDLAIKFLHKETQGGWNYDNIKKLKLR